MRCKPVAIAMMKNSDTDTFQRNQSRERIPVDVCKGGVEVLSCTVQDHEEVLRFFLASLWKTILGNSGPACVSASTVMQTVFSLYNTSEASMLIWRHVARRAGARVGVVACRLSFGGRQGHESRRRQRMSIYGIPNFCRKIKKLTAVFHGHNLPTSKAPVEDAACTKLCCGLGADAKRRSLSG